MFYDLDIIYPSIRSPIGSSFDEIFSLLLLLYIQGTTDLDHKDGNKALPLVVEENTL